MTVYGDGKQTRSFQYVSDLVDGLMRLMNSNTSQPVNLGNPDEYTMLDFAKNIRDFVGSTANIVHKPQPKDDPQRRRPDITRAKALLGCVWLVITCDSVSVYFNFNCPFCNQ